MTTNELNKYIGKEALHRTSFYRVKVRIIDMRVIYGAEQALIMPCAGVGQAWVKVDSLIMNETEKTETK